MSKTKKASQTADRAGDLYSAARENPYVQRLIEDDELRESLRTAFESAKGAYGRATGNRSLQAKGRSQLIASAIRQVAAQMKDSGRNIRNALR